MSLLFYMRKRLQRWAQSHRFCRRFWGYSPGAGSGLIHGPNFFLSWRYLIYALRKLCALTESRAIISTAISSFGIPKDVSSLIRDSICSGVISFSRGILYPFIRLFTKWKYIISYQFVYGREESKLTVSVPQLAGLVRFASNPAQSGFDSSRKCVWALPSLRTAATEKPPLRAAFHVGCAGEKNRTPNYCLEGSRFTTKLRPQVKHPAVQHLRASIANKLNNINQALLTTYCADGNSLVLYYSYHAIFTWNIDGRPHGIFGVYQYVGYPN